jgi:3'(2'), 5'-bisphosphate nucleotidase
MTEARELLHGTEHRDAARIAQEAGNLLLRIRANVGGSDPRALGVRGDRESHALIMRLLRDSYPDDGILSEEGKDDQARLEQRRVWIVDPLDGTREFGEIPRTDWAVHVALAVDGSPVVGAVAMPAAGVIFSTADPPQVPERSTERLRLVASRTRPPALLQELARTLDAEVVPMGSAGAKAMAVVSGEVDAYVHAGGQYEWDSAAPVAVAVAAGLHASRLDGRPLAYNQADPYLPDQLVCRAQLADILLTSLRPLL